MQDEAAEAVELVAPRPTEWARRYEGVAAELRNALGANVRIEHIGSTAVPDLPAKDVVDVLVGVSHEGILSAVNTLVEEGFELDGQRPEHAWLTRRAAGRRVCVVHVVQADSPRWTRRIAFRDLLREEEAARAEYLAVKLAAAAETSNWNDYTLAKTTVVHSLIDMRTPGR